jgi:AraC-like DNA-binding protein
MAAATGRTHKIPAAYAIPVLEIVSRWGVDEAQLLGPFGITRQDLTDPNRTFSLDVALDIYERAVKLTGDPALGIYLGLQMRVTGHGILGFAAMSAGSLREAILLGAKYMAIRITALSIETQVVEGVGTMVLREHAPLRGAREGYPFALLLGFWSMGRALLGRDYDASLDFAFPRPSYFDRFASALPPARFAQPQHQLVLHDLSALEARLAMADAASLRMAKDQCAQILQSLGLDGQLAPRVRSLLARSAKGILTLDGAARALHVSTRTFRRRLDAEGVTFSGLADDERKRRALLLLRSNELSLQEVGDRLGYSDVANFSRAFRRWTGKTPAAYRKAG